MNKKSKKIFISIFVLALLLLFIFEIIAYKRIKGIIEEKSKVDITNQIGLSKYKNYFIQNCDFGILESEYVFVADSREIDSDKSFLEIHFFDITRNNPFSLNWKNKFIGGATIKNTTFPELVAMVKEDCSQFQKAKGDQNDETINWSYSPAPTQEEVDERDARSFNYMLEDYLPESQELFEEIYGDPYKMTNSELAELYRGIQEDGMDERVYIKEMTTRFYKTLENITDSQKKKLREIYGDWEDLTDKELADLATKIKEELLSGEVSLD